MAMAITQVGVVLPPLSQRASLNDYYCPRSLRFGASLSSVKKQQQEQCMIGSGRVIRRSFKRLSCIASNVEKAAYAVKEITDEDLEKQVLPSDIRVLAAIRSSYNYISVMEVSSEADHLLSGSRLLLLDNPGCIHTVYFPHNVLTNSYYDALATLVPLLPEGPVGILGLGAGATSHVLHHFFPTLETHGWELDPEIIAVARQFFDLAKLEGRVSSTTSSSSSTTSGGSGSSSGFVDQVVVVEESSSAAGLTVHVGDALGADVSVEGGFAGLIVDLFAEGRIVESLQEKSTWEELKAKLKPGGRIIVNCGGDRVVAGEESSKNAGQIFMEQTIDAMREVFGDEISARYLARKGFNTIAVTGPSPDLQSWAHALPEPSRDGIMDWKPVSSSSLH